MALLLSFGLDVGSVFAAVIQTETTEPTATFFSAYSTPTDVNFSSVCPLGTPEGWGTVTPGLYWSANCGQCMLSLTPTITNTVTSTVTPGGPTITPTITPSLTPTPGNGIHREAISADPIVLTAIDTNTGAGLGPDAIKEAVTTFSRMSSGTVFAIEFLHSMQYGGTGGATGRIDGSTGILFQDAPAYVVNGSPQYVNTVLAIPAWSETSDWLIGMPGRDALWGNEAGYDTFVGLFGPASVVKSFLPAGGSSFSVGAKLETSIFFSTPSESTYTLQPIAIWYYGLPVDQPTPTPVVSYCSSLSGGEISVEEFFDEMLPPILVGEPECQTFGPINIEVPDWISSVLGFEEFVFPEVGICFQAYEFGVVHVLGMGIDLGLYLFIIGSVAVLLWFLRS